ncbi:hypothetical protein SFRURICE_008980 [Spodoptera frugiperda]|uniref:SFRICE_021744 n=1 Tax=Spodoptera frugiperda TaxID=7108 RepID=A0A2H1WLZ9_SPOFR|nr:hypothetical protein SFRURICE_008980 [Spodoptera frugiperda]
MKYANVSIDPVTADHKDMKILFPINETNGNLKTVFNYQETSNPYNRTVKKYLLICSLFDEKMRVYGFNWY